MKKLSLKHLGQVNTGIHFKKSSSIVTQEERYQLSQISHANKGPIFDFSCLRSLQKQNVSFTLILGDD